MKILYDHQAFEMQKFGGISRYFCELITQLDNTPTASVEVAIQYSHNEYLKSTRFGLKTQENPDSYENFMRGHDFRGKWNLYAARNKLRKPIDAEAINKQVAIAALQRQDFDVFHPTYYDDYFLPYIGNKPFVLTVYDMIHEIYPEYFNLADRTSDRKRRLAQKAHKILAISECTKKDLVQFFGISAEKVEVVHLASSMGTTNTPPTRSSELPARYVLFVGSRTVYKNFFFLINSIRTLLAADPELHIVCTGTGFNKNERVFFEIHGLADRVHHRSANDAELQALYQQAQVFVFPSLYEGFGLPVLEAFSCACPTVLGNSGSLPEIGGDGALYFEPKDAQSLRLAMSQALYDQALRSDLVARGQRRLALFTWEKTCRGTEIAYRELAGSQAAPVTRIRTA
ncbi:Glycosyltransferase involved in cell wall bisynthesis [Rhodoferax sp. OV413]|uniref:glycosyltransferase family 4 protein n=1 Tax=Rhodoferax sp. OV413 TaxID=1855285 RepID=UPI000890B1DB|nr:glycosyltransferase family 1 protein [Rhodoferax sp. OV413]SDO21410.1 Glycosyltransferase involved in cell wall bisynthesis [Rhodoferax sp. OV413]